MAMSSKSSLRYTVVGFISGQLPHDQSLVWKKKTVENQYLRQASHQPPKLKKGGQGYAVQPSGITASWPPARTILTAPGTGQTLGKLYQCQWPWHCDTDCMCHKYRKGSYSVQVSSDRQLSGLEKKPKSHSDALVFRRPRHWLLQALWHRTCGTPGGSTTFLNKNAT